MITLNQLNKSYKMGESSLHVLKDINLRVTEGDYITILGASGSGKSTLMNILGCMDTIDTGEYFIDGIAIHNLTERELSNIRNQKIGFIFQKYHLISTYSVLQNIILPLLIRGMSRHEATVVAKEYITLVGLEDRMDHKPSELSGGQQQRVAIARALVSQPKLLLADEPTGALDSETGKEILKLFSQLNEAGHTIVMITHDLNVAKHSKKIYHLTDGVLEDKTQV